MSDAGRPAESAPAAETGSPGSTPRAGRRRRARGKGRGKPGAAHAPQAADASQSGPVYGALDLGTNNCRLLIARRTREGFKVIDAYSRIVRLGEGLSARGALGDDAMTRAVEALKVCADKMQRRGVTRSRLIATEACRIAANGADFIARVKAETGLSLEVVSNEDEARLAVAGCAPLLDRACSSALVFDIGGGSTELIWVSMGELKPPSQNQSQNQSQSQGQRPRPRIEDWISLSCGVVTLAERHGGVDVSGTIYERMVDEVSERIAPFIARLRDAEAGLEGGFHLLGTSGTVTTIAGVHLGLPRYDRNRVDGTWITPDDVERVTRSLLEMNYDARAAHPCVGRERADLVLAGCAIFEAIARAWPAERLRVADRGLREGILLSLMEADSSRNRRRRRRRGSRSGPAAAQGKAE
ncbi:Ppx/GppA phosphatase family protein [Parvibaculum sp.]|uniref:Ppx/GppA phosphatase family protein n=1 Tax=Parvibaculum sp. TaxID=2024848 RepID=UPI0025FA0D65|nr:Ppx/GppA phosphatase family protein [Parvibaculum sp.]